MADAIQFTLKEESETMSEIIDKINKKLNNILTKEDISFIK